MLAESASRKVSYKPFIWVLGVCLPLSLASEARADRLASVSFTPFLFLVDTQTGLVRGYVSVTQDADSGSATVEITDPWLYFDYDRHPDPSVDFPIAFGVSADLAGITNGYVFNFGNEAQAAAGTGFYGLFYKARVTNNFGTYPSVSSFQEMEPVIQRLIVVPTGPISLLPPGDDGDPGNGDPGNNCGSQVYTPCTAAAIFATRSTDSLGYHVTAAPAAGVPEPNSALGLLAAGLLGGGIQWQRRKVKPSSKARPSALNFVPKVPSFLLNKYYSTQGSQIASTAVEANNICLPEPQTQVKQTAHIMTAAGVKLPYTLTTLEAVTPDAALVNLLQTHLQQNDVVLEIGAPNGLLSTYCAQVVGSQRVFVYEADAARVNRLQATYALNDVAPTIKRYLVPDLLRHNTLNQRLKAIQPTVVLLQETLEDVSALLQAIELQAIQKLLVNLTEKSKQTLLLRDLHRYLERQGFELQKGFMTSQFFVATRSHTPSAEVN